MEEKENENWKLTVMFWVAIIAIVICALGTILPCFGISKIDPQNVMVTFIGVLAAFVVVGNYVQTADMRNQTENKIKELEGKLIKSEGQLGDAKKLNNDLSATIENFKNKYDTVIKKELLSIVNNKNKTNTQSGTFGVGNKKSFNDIKEISAEGKTKYRIEFSDGLFLVDIIEESVVKLD